MFETIYLLRERVKNAAQNEVYISIESLRDVVFKELLGEDGIAIYSSEADFYEDLRRLQKLPLTISGDKVVINREKFLEATRFVERQEALLKGDKYAVDIFNKLKQRAQRIQPL